jgi:hypothetical protein
MTSTNLTLTLLTLAMTTATGTVLAVGDRPADAVPAQQSAATWAGVVGARLDWSVRPSVLTVEITNCEPEEPDAPALLPGREPAPVLPPEQRDSP